MKKIVNEVKEYNQEYLDDANPDSTKEFDSGKFQQKSSEEQVEDLSIENQKTQNQLDEQKLKNRDNIWKYSKHLLTSTTIIAFAILFLQAYGIGGFHLDDKVIMSITGGLLVEIVGVLYVVANKVFTD